MGTVVRNIVAVVGLLVMATSPVWAANIDSSQKFAWGENIGWITFEGVTVSSSALTGYAWGENVGWISLDCSNTSSCASVSYGVLNNSSGVLSGYGWGENTGWVSFNCSNTSSCATVDYGVSINVSTGQFTGYAWGENIGWIVFSCATTSSCATVDYRVTTGWRPASSASSNTGGGPNPVLSIRPSEPGQVTINNGAPVTVSPVVSLTLSAASNVRRMAVSNFADFRDSIQEPYQPQKNWSLLPIVSIETLLFRTTGATRTVYVRYFTEQGQSSPLLSASIRLAAKVSSDTPTQVSPIGPKPTLPSSTKPTPLADQQPPPTLSAPPLPAPELRPRPTAPPPTAAKPRPISFQPIGVAEFLSDGQPTRAPARSLWSFNFIGVIILVIIIVLFH